MTTHEENRRKKIQDMIKKVESLSPFELKDELIKMSNNEEQREMYDMRTQIFRDRISAFNTAKEEGKEEGRQEGIKQGVYKVATSLKQAGVQLEIIQSTTGLSMEEIAAL